MAHDVFVSYSHKDKPIADAIIAGLEHKGIRCWIAPRDITPGTSWGQAIIDALERSRVMVVILSENSNQSRQVVREVERAVAKGVIIIPFLIEDINLTGDMAYFLSTEHWLDALTPPIEEHIDQLGNTIQLFLSTGDREVVAEVFRKPGPYLARTVRKPRPAWKTILLVGIAAVLVVALSVILPRLLQPAPLAASIPSTPSPEPAATGTPSPTPLPSFQVVGEYRTSGSANGLFVANSLLTLANGANGLVRLQVSDPSEPKEVDSFFVGDQPAESVFVEDNVAYVITGEYTLQMIIMELGSNGSSIVYPPEGQRTGITSLYHVTVTNDLAHLTGHNYWGILDVSDPMNPKELWDWSPPSSSGNPCNAAIDEEIAYISCGWAGLFIFDISAPTNPELIASYETPDWIIDIEAVERVLYLTLGDGGLITVDVSDPTKPLLLGKLSLPGFSSGLSVAEDICYVTYYVYKDNALTGNGIVAVQVSDPESPELLATYDNLAYVADIQAVGNDVFVADEMRGVTIFRLTGGG